MAAHQYLASLGLNFKPIITEPEDDPMRGPSPNFAVSSSNYHQSNTDLNCFLIEGTQPISEISGNVSNEHLLNVLLKLWHGYLLEDQQQQETHVGLFFHSPDIEAKLERFY